jgi:formamidopyrimidine-DNA glycosylase
VLLAEPPTREHLRLRIALSDRRHPELLFWDRRGLGLVRLVTPVEFDERYGDKNLGPDAMALSWEELRGRLEASRREIKVALLDQRALAGVGNLYASEILHLARVHPARRCHRLRADEWQRIYAAMLEVLGEAIRLEGSTLGDGTYRNALNQQGGYQSHHRVYDRAGELCAGCGRATIERIVQAQRSTFFCPRCQPRRGSASAAKPR